MGGKLVRTIGMVHNRIGLEPRWYIGGYALVLSHLTDLAIKTYRWKAKRLAEVIAAVVFLPPTLIASIYGMNFDFMPLVHTSTGVWVTIGLMALVGVGLGLFFWRKRYLGTRAR